jgi:hypothetical protein
MAATNHIAPNYEVMSWIHMPPRRNMQLQQDKILNYVQPGGINPGDTLTTSLLLMAMQVMMKGNLYYGTTISENNVAIDGKRSLSLSLSLSFSL